MATETQSPHIFWEKISIEPDLGDQRRSTSKALPSPPKTPKRVMMKYRFSGVFPVVLSLATFMLTLVVVLAGQNVGTFEGQYLVALNTSRVGQNMISFEKTSATELAPSATPSTASSPLSPLGGPGDTLGKLSGNLTDAANDSLGDVINDIVESVIDQIGVKDFYYVYLQKICSGVNASGNEGNADGVRVDDCRSWEESGDSISTLRRRIRSSIIIGQTRVSIPLLVKLISSLDSMLESVGAMRKAIFAFLVITLVGSVLSAVSILPAVYFPQSRLLIYFNVFWAGVAAVFAFVGAMLLSTVVVLASVVDGFSDTVGVQIRQGGTVVLFVWLSFVFVGLVTLYWSSVWFVETRKSSFVLRRRDRNEIGHWKGIGKEGWRDVTGRRADV